MYKSQLQQVRDKLLKDGEITRNWAIYKAPRANTRLGARIKDLRQSGWKIKGEFVKDKRGIRVDFRYYLVGKGR